MTASLNGVFTQKPIISKWMMVVAALLLALAAIVFLVNRATAADPVPAAPVVPVLTAKNADAGVLNLVFNVSDNPERVEVELIEPPADGNFDLATAIAGTQVQSENSGSSCPVVVPLPESAEETDVFFRYRSVDADERPSIWNGESVFRSSSIEFESPVIQNVAWLDASQISVVWSTPPNPDDVTLAYRLRNADTSVPIDNAEIVSGNTNNAIVPVDGAPFAIEVQVFNADDESQQSNWSEPMAPTGERPAVSTLPAPTIVRAEWFDHQSVLVEWTSVGTGSTLTFELTDENGNRVTNAEQLTPTSVRIPMPAPTLFGVRVRALDETTGDRSPLSPAFVPDANARPSPPTIPTTTPPTTTPPTTVPTTTAPVLPKPQGFWILPQGANEPTNSTRVIWEMALGRRLKQFEVAGSDLSDLTQNLEAPLSPSSSVWVSDGYVGPGRSGRRLPAVRPAARRRPERAHRRGLRLLGGRTGDDRLREGAASAAWRRIDNALTSRTRSDPRSRRA